MKKPELIKTMSISITDTNKAAISIAPDLTASEAILLLGTLASHVLTAYYSVAKADLVTNKGKKGLTNKERNAAILGVKESIYDAADNVFSTVLANFYPEAPKLSIEDEAILELTNKKIEERYDAMSKEEREAYAKTIAVMKEQLKNAKSE